MEETAPVLNCKRGAARDGMTVEEMGLAVIETLRGVIEWAQGLPTFPKGAITLVVAVVAGLILYVLSKNHRKLPLKRGSAGCSLAASQESR